MDEREVASAAPAMSPVDVATEVTPPPPLPPPSSSDLDAPDSLSQQPAELDMDYDALSKTEVSQHLKGQQSYYYWHGDQERRRMTGEQPVPLAMPPKIAEHIETVKEKLVKGISTFSFLDDGNIVKVYIPLEGELVGLAIEQVDAHFEDRSLFLVIELPNVIFRFTVDRLMFPVDAGRCKVSINKSGKLLLKLYKRSHMDRWTKLRGQ